MVSARNKLSNKFDNSVFYHVLESPGTTSVEEVHDRNFRDIITPFVPAAWYVHTLLNFFNVVKPLERFLLMNHVWYLPEANNISEEIMLGVYPIKYYVEPNVYQYTFDEIISGQHISEPNFEYINERLTEEQDLINNGDFLELCFMVQSIDESLRMYEEMYQEMFGENVDGEIINENDVL